MVGQELSFFFFFFSSLWFSFPVAPFGAFARSPAPPFPPSPDPPGTEGHHAHVVCWSGSPWLSTIVRAPLLRCVPRAAYRTICCVRTYPLPTSRWHPLGCSRGLTLGQTQIERTEGQAAEGAAGLDPDACWLVERTTDDEDVWMA